MILSFILWVNDTFGYLLPIRFGRLLQISWINFFFFFFSRNVYERFIYVYMRNVFRLVKYKSAYYFADLSIIKMPYITSLYRLS